MGGKIYFRVITQAESRTQMITGKAYGSTYLAQNVSHKNLIVATTEKMINNLRQPLIIEAASFGAFK